MEVSLGGKKGAPLEELVREYTARQGFFALRSVLLRFEEEEVTDIDVWAYGRQAASTRTRTLIDVKEKRSPKAFERILWVRGMQLALGCDRAVVATTDNSAKVARFAQVQKVALLSRRFLDRLHGKVDLSKRLSMEDFSDLIRKNPNQKQDGDWVRQIAEVKSAVVSLPGYPAFNKAMAVFRFFAERAETRPQHKEQALRCAYFAAAIACIALDSALEAVVYEENDARFEAIRVGVTYGDTGDARVQKSIGTVLSVIGVGMENGRAVVRQVETALHKMFESVRADVIAEYFAKEHNAAPLFATGKELEDLAHRVDASELQVLSTEAKSILGIFADFTQVQRIALFGRGSHGATEPQSGNPDASKDSSARSSAKDGSTNDNQSKLL